MKPEVNRSLAKNSDFDPDHPDFECFPLARYMDGWEFVLEEGDVLYNPPYYWHHATNLTHSIGMGHRYADLHSALRISPLFSLLELLNTNPWVIRSMYIVITQEALKTEAYMLGRLKELEKMEAELVARRSSAK